MVFLNFLIFLAKTVILVLDSIFIKHWLSNDNTIVNSNFSDILSDNTIENNNFIIFLLLAVEQLCLINKISKQL